MTGRGATGPVFAVGLAAGVLPVRGCGLEREWQPEMVKNPIARVRNRGKMKRGWPNMQR